MGYGLDKFYPNNVLGLFLVTDNLLAVARKFLRPRLAVSRARSTSLRLTKTICVCSAGCILPSLLYQFMWIMVRTKLIRATLGDRFCAFHHECATRGCAVGFRVGAEIAGGFCLDRVLAVRVVSTTIKNTKATFALGHKTFLADRAGDTGVIQERRSIVFFDVLTFGIAAAGDEAPKAPFAFNKVCLATLWTKLSCVARPRKLGTVDRACAVAVGIFFT